MVGNRPVNRSALTLRAAGYYNPGHHITNG